MGQYFLDIQYITKLFNLLTKFLNFLCISAELATADEDEASVHRLQPERCVPGGSAGLLVPLLHEARGRDIGGPEPRATPVRVHYRQLGGRGSATQGPAVLQICEGNYTICPKSSDPSYRVRYYIRCFTTSWTYST